jgi:acyl-CoA thioester hydrolase
MAIVHHSNYPIWYEAGRTDFTAAMGMPYDQIEEQGVMFPLLELHCKYIQAAKYGDVVIVETSITKLSIVKVEFSYKVYRESDGVLLNTGSTVHGMVTKELRPMNMKKEKPEIFALMGQALEK